MYKLLKLLQIGLIASISLQTVTAQAHAVVTDTTLEIESIKPQQPAEISLKFNSKIELALSQIFLVSKGDRQTKLEAVQGPDMGQVIVSVPPLESGEYALRFKVFAADGHLTEDFIHFFVTQ
ncbi:MAG: copper resistance CopC family protein [Gammaproteobacteria bacterium]